MHKLAHILTILALGMVVLLPVNSTALEGYLSAKAGINDEAWVKTSQGRWHYDKGPAIEIRLVERGSYWEIVAHTALTATDMVLEYCEGLGFGVSGQRAGVGAAVWSDVMRLDLRWQYSSWFIEGPKYGPNWMIQPNDTSHKVDLTVTMRIF